MTATEESTARTEASASAPIPADNSAAPDWVKACRSTEQRPITKGLHLSVVFDMEGGPWTGAANGHRLGAVRGALSGAPLATEVGAPNFPNVMSLPENADRRHEINLTNFREWLGVDRLNPNCDCCEGKGKWECENCDGIGEYTCVCTGCDDEHQAECDECLGEGAIICAKCFPSSKRDYASIFGSYFDRSVLRPVVQLLPYETCYFHLRTSPERAIALYDDSDSWRVIIMPCRGERLSTKKLPSYASAVLAVDSSRSTPDHASEVALSSISPSTQEEKK